MQKERMKKKTFHPWLFIGNADRCAFFFHPIFYLSLSFVCSSVCRCLHFAHDVHCTCMCWFYFGLMLVNWQRIKCHWTFLRSFSLAQKSFFVIKWNEMLDSILSKRQTNVCRTDNDFHAGNKILKIWERNDDYQNVFDCWKILTGHKMKQFHKGVQAINFNFNVHKFVEYKGTVVPGNILPRIRCSSKSDRWQKVHKEYI